MSSPVLLDKVTALYFSRSTQNMNLREKAQKKGNKFLESMWQEAQNALSFSAPSCKGTSFHSVEP